MEIAVKLDPINTYPRKGYEPILFRAQMFVDVFFHEKDPIPTLQDFLMEPMSRPDGKMFWVYRQGTYLSIPTIQHGLLFIGSAKTEDLDASPEPTFEGYHHVPTILLDGGGKFNLFFKDSFYTLERLYELMQNE